MGGMKGPIDACTAGPPRAIPEPAMATDSSGVGARLIAMSFAKGQEEIVL